MDIGDRVKAGQVLAEIEAPELGQQIHQAKAAIDQASSSVQQAEAALQQGRSQRQSGAGYGRSDGTTCSRRDRFAAGQRYGQAQYRAQQANVQALEKAVAAARSNIAAAEANLARLNELLGYQTVRAPFAGVITLRNIDSGVLVTEGSTLLFRIAQTDRLRTYLNVPQADAGSVRCRAAGRPGDSRFARPQVQRDGDAHGQRARSCDANAAGGSAGGESRRRL